MVYTIRGDSMKGFYNDGEYIETCINDDGVYDRGDCVVVKVNDEQKILKRIYGIPGDHFHVDGDLLYINDTPIVIYYSEVLKSFENQWNSVLPENNYIILGTADNSYDSRVFGPILNTCIIGKVIKILE